MFPCRFWKPHISLLVVAYCCTSWVISEPDFSDLGYLIETNTVESALWLPTSPLKGGHQDSSWQGKVWLELCPGGGWMPMTTWPLKLWESSTELRYLLFLMLLLKCCLIWHSFSCLVLLLMLPLWRTSRLPLQNKGLIFLYLHTYFLGELSSYAKRPETVAMMLVHVLLQLLCFLSGSWVAGPNLLLQR